MELKVHIYYQNENGEYCFACAVKEIIKNPKIKMSTEITSSRYDFECHRCGEYIMEVNI